LAHREKALSGCLAHLTVSQSLKDHTRNRRAERFTMSPLDKTALVVEDNDLNRKLFCNVLKAHSYNVL
jgi:hypothetical protein